MYNADSEKNGRVKEERELLREEWRERERGEAMPK